MFKGIKMIKKAFSIGLTRLFKFFIYVAIKNLKEHQRGGNNKVFNLNNQIKITLYKLIRSSGVNDVLLKII